MDKFIKNKNTYIQYDPNVFKNFNGQLFNVDYIAKEGLIKSEISGRGKAYEIRYQGKNYILKNYIRGGFVSKITYNKYIYNSISSTRSVKEYNFLNNLFSKGLSVPKPAALKVFRNKITYTAALITRKIENIGTLHDFILSNGMNSKLWDSLELTLESFFKENVYHSDLNSKNVLIDKNHNFYLIDFDNSYFFYEKKLFLKSIMRLERSLSKLDNYKGELNKIVKKFS